MPSAQSKNLSSQIKTWISELEREANNPLLSNAIDQIVSQVRALEDKITELDKRNKTLSDQIKRTDELQEAQSSRNFRMANHLEKLRSDLEEQRREQEFEISNERERLKNERTEFEALKERYTKENQEELSKATTHFVELTIKTLENSRSHSNKLSNIWALLGATSLLSSFIFIFTTYSTIQSLFFEFRLDYLLMKQPVLDWPTVIFFSVKGVVLVSLFGFFGRYSFIMFKENRIDAKLNTDRNHGIKFGQLYLNSYGASADWDQLKEAFSYWHEDPKGQEIKIEDFNSEASLSSLTELVKSLAKLAK